MPRRLSPKERRAASRNENVTSFFFVPNTHLTTEL